MLTTLVGSRCQKRFVENSTSSAEMEEIAFLAFNEPVQQLKTIHPGTTMKVNFRVESREYNGRWYTDIRAVSISPLMASAPSEAAPSNNGYAAPAPMTADPMAGAMGGGNDVDDLPF